MTTIKQDGIPYEVRDAWCIGRSCLALGRIDIETRRFKGSRDTRWEEHCTGEREHCCLTRAFLGCPK